MHRKAQTIWGSVHLNCSKTVCGNLQRDLLRKNAGNVLLLLIYYRYRKLVMFLSIKNTKDGVCRGVIIVGQIFSCIIESSLASYLGSPQNQDSFQAEFPLFQPKEQLACSRKGSCLLAPLIENKHLTQHENSELITQKKNMLIQGYAHDLCKCTGQSSGE